MSEWDDFQEVTGMLSRKASDVVNPLVKAYKEWGARNQAKLNEIPGMERMMRLTADIAQTPGADVMMGYLTAPEITKKLLQGPLDELIAGYKYMKSRWPNTTGPAAFKRYGKGLIPAVQGGLATKETPLTSMIEKGISPYVNDLTATLQESKGSGGRAYPYPEYAGYKVREIFPKYSNLPERDLELPSLVIRKQRSPNLWLDALFHEGTHMGYRTNPEIAEKVLNLTRSYQPEGYATQVMKAFENRLKNPFPYVEPSAKRFEESLAAGVANRAVVRAIKEPTHYHLHDSLINSLYRDRPLLEELTDLFYGGR